jgi:glycerophosphoryl diester phosphodiesterase
MKKVCCILLCGLFFLSCKKNVEAPPVPDLTWDLFESAAAQRLPAASFQKMEGVYTIDQGTEDFGTLAPARWSYTVEGTDTTYHLSFFLGQDAAYIVCEGRRVDSTILLNGYWRKMVSTATGSIRLTIAKDSGAALLLDTGSHVLNPSVLISGVYSLGNTAPDIPIRLRYTRTLYRATPFEILAHRCGGRTADLLPASENSVEMTKLAARFGATGIETDVQLTKDGVPIIYHDATLNERLIQKNGLVGPISNYTYDQLYTLVRLTHGEHIPTLREILHTVVYNTPLEFVWLDSKYPESLQAEKELQAEFLQKAAAIGRKLEIVIGIPDKDVLAQFKKMPGYQNIPSLVEFSPTEATAVSARVWGPQWTLGLQNEEVAAQQAQGRRVFTWTVDIAENVQRYMREGRFDGILSNYPSLTAFYYYARQ